jgi:hypothetical protein
VSDTPLVPTPLYGLRTWTVVAGGRVERLAGPQQHATWPPGGVWFEATCTQSDHRPPAHGCGCGFHAWHPSRRSARRVFASRREIPGIVEARGTIELHDDGFRAERARPYALVLAPGRNARLVRRLAEAYRAQVVEADGPDALLTFCRAQGLGLDQRVVAQLLGPEKAEECRRARRQRARRDALRLAAAVAVAALLVVAGLQVTTDPTGDRVLHGRTGEIHTNSR